MSNNECPRSDCMYNLPGGCHHALRPNPKGCRYYRPRPEETLPTSNGDPGYDLIGLPAGSEATLSIGV